MKSACDHIRVGLGGTQYKRVGTRNESGFLAIECNWFSRSLVDDVGRPLVAPADAKLIDLVVVIPLGIVRQVGIGMVGEKQRQRVQSRRLGVHGSRDWLSISTAYELVLTT